MGRSKVNRYNIPTGLSQTEKIKSMLRLLEIDTAAAELDRVLESIVESGGSYSTFLENLLELEFTSKEEKRLNRWMRFAGFPKIRTLKDFDFSYQPGINQKQLKELAGCGFIEQGKNVVFLGSTGVGKTHLAIALGMEAIEQGYETVFLKVYDLIAEVEKPEQDLNRLLRSWVRPKLLILDEIDFYNTGKNASTFLFKLIHERHDNEVSTIVTSNNGFDAWEALFGGSRATAAVDRIVGGATVINIIGDSYRLKDNLLKPELI